MEFCPPNITFSDVWSNHGISHCFMDTVSTSVIAGFIFLFGSIQLWMYKRYATRNYDVNLASVSKFYYFQLFLLVLMPILAIVRFGLETTFFIEAKTYGYMVSNGISRLGFYDWSFKEIFGLSFQILAVTLTCFSFLYSIVLLLKERHYQLPSVPARGHGLVLLLFWTLAFISENITFVNLNRDDWWFKFNSLKDKVEMSLFAARYITCLFIFVLGLTAPGIVAHREDDYIHLRDDANAVSADVRRWNVFSFRYDGDWFHLQENRSTWVNSWRKMRTLFPYLWPRRSIALQLRVILCIILVIAGRVINVYVPVYNQRIGKQPIEHPQQLIPESAIYYFSRQLNWHHLPLGLGTALRILQVPARRRHRHHGFPQQFSLVPVDSHPAIYNSWNWSGTLSSPAQPVAALALGSQNRRGVTGHGPWNGEHQ